MTIPKRCLFDALARSAGARHRALLAVAAMLFLAPTVDTAHAVDGMACPNCEYRQHRAEAPRSAPFYQGALALYFKDGADDATVDDDYVSTADNLARQGVNLYGYPAMSCVYVDP